MIYSGRQTWSQATTGQYKAPPLQEAKLVNHLRYTSKCLINRLVYTAALEDDKGLWLNSVSSEEVCIEENMIVMEKQSVPKTF